jgi:hypothetical protein
MSAKGELSVGETNGGVRGRKEMIEVHLYIYKYKYIHIYIHIHTYEDRTMQPTKYCF